MFRDAQDFKSGPYSDKVPKGLIPVKPMDEGFPYKALGMTGVPSVRMPYKQRNNKYAL